MHSTRSRLCFALALGAVWSSLGSGCANQKVAGFSELAAAQVELQEAARNVARRLEGIQIEAQVVRARAVPELTEYTFLPQSGELRDWIDTRRTVQSVLTDYLVILDAWFGKSPDLLRFSGPSELFVDRKSAVIEKRIVDMKLELGQIEGSALGLGDYLGLGVLDAGNQLVAAVEAAWGDAPTRLGRTRSALLDLMEAARPSLGQLCLLAVEGENDTRRALEHTIKELLYQLNSGRPPAYSDRRLAYDADAARVLVPAVASTEALDMIRDAVDMLPEVHEDLRRAITKAPTGTVKNPATLDDFLLQVRRIRRRSPDHE